MWYSWSPNHDFLVLVVHHKTMTIILSGFSKKLERQNNLRKEYISRMRKDNQLVYKISSYCVSSLSIFTKSVLHEPTEISFTRIKPSKIV